MENVNETGHNRQVSSSNVLSRSMMMPALGALPGSSFSVQVNLANVNQMNQNLVHGLNSPETLFGLAERTISSESVVYLIKQFRKLKALILKSIPQDEEEIFKSIDEYYHQVEKSFHLILRDSQSNIFKNL